MNPAPEYIPGPIALFGSGETAPNGRKVFQALLERLPDRPRIHILETPAGFELNSRQVAGKIAAFIDHHLQNFHPQVDQIPARKKGTELSPNNRELLQPLLTSEVIFLGPGSPTYAVRQLKGSQAWDYLRACHRAGAGLALASASTIAVSAHALPVYEIYKVGMDIHWQPGLDLLSDYQLSLSFIPHWNNTEGGEELDTSRCYMGSARFQAMLELLSPDHTLIGIDEHTGMLIDFQQACCQVIGLGRVTILSKGKKQTFPADSEFKIRELGEMELPDPSEHLPVAVWEEVLRVRREDDKQPQAPEQITALAEKRMEARKQQQWEKADSLREEILRRGWDIQDTENGYTLLPGAQTPT